MPTVAVVEDDRTALGLVKDLLEEEGYSVTAYHDGPKALDAFDNKLPDLVLLDVKMPRMDGMELLRRLRTRSEIPVILVTGLSDEIDELLGLRLGADDYIHKPFSERVLLERVRSVMRRFYPPPANDAKMKSEILERGELRMDYDRHACTWKGKHRTLTTREYALLDMLASRPGVMRTREALMAALYDEGAPMRDRVIDSHVKRLRAKFRAVDASFDMIETLYGVGYRYRQA
jgi:two-component system, OmpR family, response regulator ChvI